MNLIQKIKNIFNKNEKQSIESKDRPILETECKYELKK